MIFEHPDRSFDAGFGEHRDTMLGNVLFDHIEFSDHTAFSNEAGGRHVKDDPLDPFHSPPSLALVSKANNNLVMAADEGDIVITGVRHTTNSDDGGGYDGTWGSGSGSGGTGTTGGSGGGGGGYMTAGVSGTANAFADSHVHNNGTTAADEKEYEKAHDDVAKLYDWAQAHPNDIVDIGNGHTITGAQLSADLAAMTINIVDAGGGPSGANTFYSGSTGTTTITINPNSSNVQTYNDPNNFSGTGADYVVFHEIGHSVYDVSYGGLQGVTAEAQADAAANSLEHALGIPTFTH